MAMTTVRTAVEAALDETAARLRGALATWPQTAHAAVILDACHQRSCRSQQLVQLPEFPMRLTEAEELRRKVLTHDYAHSCARELYPTAGKIRDAIIKISDDETKFVYGMSDKQVPGLDDPHGVDLKTPGHVNPGRGALRRPRPRDPMGQQSVLLDVSRSEDNTISSSPARSPKPSNSPTQSTSSPPPHLHPGLHQPRHRLQIVDRVPELEKKLLDLRYSPAG
jgi:hypothetical protein